MIPTTTAPSGPQDSFNNNRNNIEKSVVGAASETEEDQMPTVAPRIEASPVSTAVDIGPEPNPRPKRKPQASFWSKLSKAATVVEEHLAEWLGLNDSKYQWAVDEAMKYQLAGESQEKPAPSETLDKVQTEPASQQAMHIGPFTNCWNINWASEIWSPMVHSPCPLAFRMWSLACI